MLEVQVAFDMLGSPVFFFLSCSIGEVVSSSSSVRDLSMGSHGSHPLVLTDGGGYESLCYAAVYIASFPTSHLLLLSWSYT